MRCVFERSVVFSVFSSMCFLFSVSRCPCIFFFFFFNDTATTEIYTLSLHDALPIYGDAAETIPGTPVVIDPDVACQCRSEEHTSELQSLAYLVCRLLLEKKKKKKQHYNIDTLEDRYTGQLTLKHYPQARQTTQLGHH